MQKKCLIPENSRINVGIWAQRRSKHSEPIHHSLQGHYCDHLKQQINPDFQIHRTRKRESQTAKQLQELCMSNSFKGKEGSKGVNSLGTGSLEHAILAKTKKQNKPCLKKLVSLPEKVPRKESNTILLQISSERWLVDSSVISCPSYVSPYDTIGLRQWLWK